MLGSLTFNYLWFIIYQNNIATELKKKIDVVQRSWGRSLKEVERFHWLGLGSRIFSAVQGELVLC